MKQYDDYTLTVKDWVITIMEWIFFTGVIAFLFYDHIAAFLIALPGVFGYVKLVKKQRIIKRKEQITLEFKEMMQSIATALNAGYALENSFYAARDDLQRLYPDGSSYLAIECEYLIRNMEINESIEAMLKDLGERTKIAEIRHFAKVIAIAKRSGGNILAIIRDSSKQLNEALEVKREIRVLVASKQLEQRIMLGMPFVIIAYLRIGNQGYLDVLYGNVAGVIVMSIALAIIALSAYLSGRIMNISVGA